MRLYNQGSTDHCSCFFAGEGHYFYPGLEILPSDIAERLPGGFPGTVSLEYKQL